jgi:hypothetical protein
VRKARLDAEDFREHKEFLAERLVHVRLTGARGGVCVKAVCFNLGFANFAVAVRPLVYFLQRAVYLIKADFKF